MAISHAQTLVLFLVSLSISPALGDIINLRYCKSYPHSPVKIETAKISPMPIRRSSSDASFTLIGNTDREIPEGVIIKLELRAFAKRVSIKRYSLCDITACPVRPGPIVLTFTNVLTEEELKGMIYTAWIHITEDEEKLDDTMMCVLFTFRIKKGFMSMLHQATE